MWASTKLRDPKVSYPPNRRRDLVAGADVPARLQERAEDTELLGREIQAAVVHEGLMGAGPQQQALGPVVRLGLSVGAGSPQHRVHATFELDELDGSTT